MMKCIQRDLNADPEGTTYCYKFDVRRFYDNVKPDFVMWCYHREADTVVKEFSDKLIEYIMEK